MPKIRALIVDDSVVIRRLLTVYLASDPAIEVVGSAADGQIGLAKIPQVNPDVVVLDIEMPVMDGLQTVAEIRKIYKTLPIIMFSTLTERGAVATLNALSLGANDYATKSTNQGTARQQVCTELIPKIKALCSNIIGPPTSATPLVKYAARPASPAPLLAPTPIDVLAIGSSTGGPNALAALICGLAPHFPVPVVMVQHMPQIFTRLLAERLATLSGFRINEAVPGELLRPGEMWVAAGGFHMEVVKGVDGVRLRTHTGPPENSCRPAVDVLFRSVAHVYGARTLAVVLTGMGQDGMLGCEVIREAGGRVLAQDEASSVVWGMPGAVTRAGLPEKVLPLMDMAAEINRLIPVHPTTQSKPLAAMANAPCAVPA